MIADDTQTTVWKWEQAEPFGNSTPNEYPDNNTVAFEFPLRFPGQYFDKETGLNYNYFRDYDPAIGRYVESDPIGLGGGLNSYAYVKGNPLRLTDTTGLLDDQSEGSGGGGGDGGSKGDRCRLVKQVGPVGVLFLLGLPRYIMICIYDCGSSCPPKPGDIIANFQVIWNYPYECQPTMRRP